MVGHNRFGNGRSNGVNLCGNSTTLDADANIKVGELLLTNNQDGFKHLESELFWLNVFNWLTIDLDQTAALLGESASSGSLFPVVNKGTERLDI